jgi:excisionase family DNA binding protein
VRDRAIATHLSLDAITERPDEASGLSSGERSALLARAAAVLAALAAAPVSEAPRPSVARVADAGTGTCHDRLLNVSEVAQRLGLKPATIRSWISTHRLPVTRLGRRVLIASAAIEKMVAENTIPSNRMS